MTTTSTDDATPVRGPGAALGGSGDADARAARVLDAGGVVPVGEAGEIGELGAVEVAAWRYRHGGLPDERVVVRLAPLGRGDCEDRAAAFLGLVRDGAPAVVGVGRETPLRFPDWVLVHHPECGNQALALVPELELLGRQAKSRPKAAMQACRRLVERLAASVPLLLPFVLEEAARGFLAAEQPAMAGQLFAQARKSEAVHGLGVDQDRVDAVFLEFALAGALPVRALTGYAKDLEQRLPADLAYERFRRLCVRRTAGGTAPATQAAAPLRRLARAAGLDAAAAEGAHVAELLRLPATRHATAAWWRAHRSALADLARRDPAVRGTLLALTPPVDADGEDTVGFWLELLREVGATDGLVLEAAAEEERSPDGTAGWLERLCAARRSGWGPRPGLPALLDLAERCAGRLRAELAERGEGLRIGGADVDLLDLLLVLEVPVVDPGAGDALALEDWAGGEQRRDLAGLAADERFRPAFALAADALPDTEAARTVLRRLAAAPGGRILLADWVRGLARACARTGLPHLPAAVGRLARLPAGVLALAPEEVAEAAATDLADLLARSLRGGLFEELTWPAWEEALAVLAPDGDRREVSVTSAWPHLVVANQRHVRVIGADGTVLVHDLRIPYEAGHRTLGLHYVDGELLVCWRYWNRPGETKAYWHGAPADVFTLDTGGRSAWQLGPEHAGLPLPGGGRATGAGVLRRGDTRLPAERPLIGDGRAYWAWDEAGVDGKPGGWAEYDPAADRLGPRSRPAFLGAASGLPSGAVLREEDCRLRPGVVVEGSVLSPPVGGLLGWRAAELPDGGWWGGDAAGRTVTVPQGAEVPFGAAVFPGDDRPRALSQKWSEFRITDPDGTVTAETRSGSRPAALSAGGPPMPPAEHWYCLRPRDPQGSLVLRGVDAPAAAALIAAGSAAAAGGSARADIAEGLLPVVRDALPQVTDPVLVRGVADLLAFTLDQQTSLDQGLGAGRRDEGEPQKPDGPDDRIIGLALRGISGSVHRDWVGRGAHTLSATLSAFAAAAADTAATAVPGRLHGDVPSLPWCTVAWIPLLGQPGAVAYRAAAAATGDEEREALLGLLRAWDRLGLDSAAAGRWRRAVLHLDAGALRRPDGTEWQPQHRGLLPLGGGAFLATNGPCSAVPDGYRIEGLQYDPEGRFELPDAYTARAVEPLGDPEREGGWLSRFLDSAAERGPVPWIPAAADAFARLTGTTDTLARLVVAGLPAVDSDDRGFLTAEQRTLLDVRAADAEAARADLRCLPADVRRALVAALLPRDPERLWTDGPDTAAAAELWNRRVGRRTRIPDRLASEAAQEVRTWWPAVRALPAVLDPQNAPELSSDAEWELGHDRAVPKGPAADAFSARVLLGAVAMTAWLAHRLPAGDPARSRLPAALAAVRERLAAPGLLLDLGRHVDLRELRKAAGAPTRTDGRAEEYGALVTVADDSRFMPALRPALLDSTGGHPYVALLRGTAQQPLPVEVALRCVHDPRFAALLADPGADGEGTWWPQDPGRSVPELVDAVQEAYRLGADAAALYLMLLAMPDPTDRNTARWTGWKPARMKAARAELGATDLVVTASRTRAGRTLFLPGGWVEPSAPWIPLEQWKAPMYGLLAERVPLLGVLVPTEPAADLYRRAWRRITDGDVPRFGELELRRRGRRR
ncbi:DNA-binding protein [Streptomyces toxytricini]|uniref:DNA-binding protein n=1 Tax=Streptomyces toxytricini TaxID=67369 RepID=A0ABW8EGD5_STRT5